MAPKIFITGGTGFVGGSVLHTIATAHPEYDITALLRRIPDGFSAKYPSIKVVEGDYDSAGVISDAAAAADIVVHNGDSDHEASLEAIIAGLLRRPTPGYLMHLSGTGIISDWAEEEHLGRLNSKVWSDVSSLADIRSLPAGALHRNTEVILHSTARDHGDKIRIAVMCPPDIYGSGSGPGKQHSVFVDMYVKEIKDLGGKVFYYGEGANTRSWVHIADLMKVYLAVVEAAARGDEAGDYFNGNGYFFAGTQEHSQLDVAKVVGRVLHAEGVVGSPEPEPVRLAQLDNMISYPGLPFLGRYLFASNSRSRAERAEALFGYKGEQPSLLDSLEADVKRAIERTR